MSYSIKIEINGFDFQFGDMGFPISGLGAFISFNDPKIEKAIANDDPEFYSAIRGLLNSSEEFDALYTMAHFEHYHLQGHGWKALTDHYNFSSLEKFKRQAEIVLDSENANDDQRITAQTLLDVLNGDYQYPQPPEKSPSEKAKASFENKKPKLRLKLTIRDGYQCDNCSKDTEGSLCIMKKDTEIDSYELDNLILRCRGCINKLKKK